MTREEALSYGNDYYTDLISACCKIDKKHKEFVKMSIKALEQEPCEDAISRQDVWFKLTNGAYDGETTEQFIDRIAKEIESMPSVNPQEPKWIPVSEKMPLSDEEYHTFLVTDSNGKVTLSDFYLSLSDGKPYWSGMVDVVAWMPLPQPYKTESEAQE